MSDESSMKRCVCCARSAELLCARCNDSYCSIECQKADWQMHRQICFKMPNLIPDRVSEVEMLEKQLYSTLVFPKTSHITSPSTMYGSLEDIHESGKSQEAPVAATDAIPATIKASASVKVAERPKQEPHPKMESAEPRKITTIKLNVKKPTTAPKLMDSSPVAEKAKEEPAKPLMYLDLKFRVWPDTKVVKTKILGALETNILTLREDLHHIDGYFELINSEVAKYANSQPRVVDYHPLKGELVLALFEGEWYRAHVIDPKTDGFIVQYIDYGNMAIVKQGELMPASKALLFDVCTRDFIIDNMPDELDEKQQEILQSGAITITNIHRVSGVDYHCNIFGF